MAIAMPSTALGATLPARLRRPGDSDAALTMGDVSAEMLSVSRDGWHRLLDHCPDRWTDVQQHLRQAIARIEATLAERQAGEPPPA